MAISFDDVTFANVLCDHQIEGPWRDWLLAKLAERDTRIRIDENDMFWQGDLALGYCLLADLPAAAAEPAIAPLLDRAPQRWVGRPAGVFAWTHFGDFSELTDSLIPALMRYGRGPFVRLDGKSEEVRESFRLRRLRLRELDSRHGFENGGVFLSDPDYLHEACECAEAALRELGFEGMVGIWPHDNRLRVAGDLKRNGEVVSSISYALDNHCFEFWAYDWDINSSRCEFWWDR
jgi:hypothetical protein